MRQKQPQRSIDILLIDDDSANRHLVKSCLQEGPLHPSVSLAVDGLDGMEFLHRLGPYADAPRPDLVLLDLNMPRKDGWEFLKEIKADPALRRIPILVLSSSDSQVDVNRAYDLHANGYLHKPSSLEELCTSIRSIEQFWFDTVLSPDHVTVSAGS